MTSHLVRRLSQAGIALALAGTVVLVTQWAYPAGHLVVRLGSPHYSRVVGEGAMFVTVDITIKNVGADPITIDREHFLLVDTGGHTYRSDPSTHFLRNHFDIIRIPAGETLSGATVYKIPPGRTAAFLVFVTPTGQLVRFRLS